MAQRKVLIVEDEPAICEGLKVLLERNRCQVFTALKSENGLEIFKKEKPQSVVIDIHMGTSTYDGMELLRRIRDIDKTALIVMFTCVTDEKIHKEAERLGANKYMEKPADGEGMRELIDYLALGK